MKKPALLFNAAARTLEDKAFGTVQLHELKTAINIALTERHHTLDGDGTAMRCSPYGIACQDFSVKCVNIARKERPSDRVSDPDRNPSAYPVDFIISANIMPRFWDSSCIIIPFRCPEFLLLNQVIPPDTVKK